MATLHELQTVYSYEDALDMMEALQVCDYNEREMMRAAERQRKG